MFDYVNFPFVFRFATNEFQHQSLQEKRIDSKRILSSLIDFVCQYESSMCHRITAEKLVLHVLEEHESKQIS